MRLSVLSLCLFALTGTLPGQEPTPKPSLQVEPGQFLLKGQWASQQLVAIHPDVAVQDLTPQAEYKSADPKIARVGKDGIVYPVSDGETTVSVSARSLSAEVRVTVKEAADPAVEFNDVMAFVGKLGCNTSECHGSSGGRGGFRLSLFGAEPASDYDALVRGADGRRVNRVEPAQSLFLQKATNEIQHKGGQRIRPGSREHAMLSHWVAQGAPPPTDKQPQPISLAIFPGERVLKKGETQQLGVTALYADGTRKDATRWAKYASADGNVVSADATGKVKAEDFGETFVTATFLRRSAVARVLVPQPLAAPFPAVKPNNRIDELCLAKLARMGIPPSDLCTDTEFLRRITLDVTGTLPKPAEARAFLADADPQKRAKLIDRLLESEEFSDFEALKWGDLLRIKSEYPVNLWPKGAMTYFRWVRQSFIENKPFDQFAREMLTSTGSNFRSGPANFFRAVPKKDPQTVAESAALILMGARVGCARCHAHPTESWTLDDDLGLAAFFSKISYKASTEWKEEIVYLDPKKSFNHPRTKAPVKPKLLDGPVVEVGPEEDARIKFADWLTAPDNPWFARNIVNRIWFWLLGRGLVHEPDDLRPSNPPRNPELLKHLEMELVQSKFNLNHIYRLILNSRTYQLSSASNEGNAKDTTQFSRYPMKRLGAEQLLDAISRVTETSEPFTSQIPEPYSYFPPSHPAVKLHDGSVSTSFLELFGRPSRDTPYESERDSGISLWQALYFINSDQLENKVIGSPRLKRLLQENKSDSDIIDEFVLAALSRPPSEVEKKKMLDYAEKNKKTRAQALGDLVWAILNTKEFLFIH